MVRSTSLIFIAVAFIHGGLISSKPAMGQQPETPPVRLRFSDETPTTGRVAKRKITKANRIPSEMVLGKGPTVRLVAGEEPAQPARLPARLRANDDLKRLPPAQHATAPTKSRPNTKEPVAPKVDFDTSIGDQATWAIPTDTKQTPGKIEAFRPSKSSSRPTRNVQASHVAWDAGDDGVRPAFWSEQTRLAQNDPLSELEKSIDALDKESPVAPTPPALRKRTAPSQTKPLPNRRRLRLDFLPEDEDADSPLDRLERSTGSKKGKSTSDYPYEEVPVVPTPPKRPRANYAYTLADILNDDEDAVDPCIEQAYCNAVWACAGGKCLRPIDRWRREWNRNRVIRNGSCNPEYNYRAQGPNFNRNAYLGYSSNDLKYQIDDGRGPARISDEIQYAGRSVRPKDTKVHQVDYEAESEDEIWYRAKR